METREIEEWRPAVGYEGLYEVSSLGRIKSLAREIDHSYKGKIYKRSTQERILIPTSNVRHKYYSVPLTDQNRVLKRRTIHRLVAMAFIPNPGNKENVNHINGIKTDNRVGNLEWCTIKENVKHARENGLTNQEGERGCNSKLSDKEALEIREIYSKGGIKMDELGKRYNVSKSSISRIVIRQSYRHI